MIKAQYVQTMARYNKWQNESMYGAASNLSADARQKDCGAFFESIHCTLSHLLWGDQIWMHRFADTPMPEADGIQASTEMICSWEELCEQRAAFDAVILNWSKGIKDTDLEGDLTWFSGAARKEITKPLGFLITQMFNHQTHHRGQVHAMITAAGGSTDDTDLIYLK